MKSARRNLGLYQAGKESALYSKKINPMKTEVKNHSFAPSAVFLKLTFIACFLLGFMYTFLWLIKQAIGH